MIVGVGHDVVHIPRIAQVLQRWEQSYLDRIFSAEEQAYCRGFVDPSPHFAARFAAKEAFFKALSRGRPLRLGFQDAAVIHRRNQTLELTLSEQAQALVREAGVTGIQLSLSHDGEYASAFVVLEG